MGVRESVLFSRVNPRQKLMRNPAMLFLTHFRRLSNDWLTMLYHPADVGFRQGSCLLVLCCLVVLSGTAAAIEPCRICVVDEENDWPVPLVELRTTHNVRFITDNAGVIAFDLPELMNVETWFYIEGHGYSVKADGFGYRGVKLIPRAGQTLVVRVKREMPAKRLGRITGGGLFAESQKIGDASDWVEQRILGCDSVQNAVHNGKLFWAWGDTVLPNYPLGRFHMIGATSPLDPLKSFEPPIRYRYNYFCDETGTPKNIAPMPGAGPTWLNGLVSLPDRDGNYRLVATYAKIQPPLTTYELGLCIWDESTQLFQRFKVLWSKTDEQPNPPPAPHGHPVIWKDSEAQTWVLFGDPFPTLKCPATFEAWSDPQQWQTVSSPETVVSGSEQIKVHRGAMAWNEYRNRWVSIFTQLHGQSSELGELWYAEAETPLGPWGNAIKVVTHDHYSFYNPQLHPQLAPADSPILLFEATYTHTFSRTQSPTPRHDYNQVLYRLDLDRL
jgi:hypothetical protein